MAFQKNMIYPIYRGLPPDQNTAPEWPPFKSLKPLTSGPYNFQSEYKSAKKEVSG